MPCVACRPSADAEVEGVVFGPRALERDDPSIKCSIWRFKPPALS